MIIDDPTFIVLIGSSITIGLVLGVLWSFFTTRKIFRNKGYSDIWEQVIEEEGNTE